MESRKVRYRTACAFAIAAAFSLAANAQNYPSQNVIRISVPTGPGSPPDVISRLIANEISESEGWKFVVENRPGALQTIAMADVLKQPANGLSIFPMSMGAITVPTLMPESSLSKISSLAFALL